MLIVPIIAASYFLILEANETLANKQLIYFAVGFLAFSFVFVLPIRKLSWMIPFFYWIGIILLASVEFFGISKLGAKRWLDIPLVHFTIQPSEIIKPAFILMLAYLIHSKPPGENGYGLKDFLKLSFYILLPFFLIAKEPDLGTALVLLLVGFGILFIIGVDKKIWIGIVVMIGIASPLLYNSLHDYQKKRIADFLSEKPSYHVKQSVIAIGSGGLYGKSKDEATQTHFKFLPIATSDFIFAYLVERSGFWGAFLLICCYAFLVLHLMSFNLILGEDYFTKVVASGISLLIFIYMGVNISMTIGLAPVVGVPLPFFSYGGSSFITFMLLFGLLENLLAFRFDYLYSSIKYNLKL
jgi:rod shape determining protein RodA